MEKVHIERYSDQLEGIGFVNNKPIFIPKTKVGNDYEYSVVKENSKVTFAKAMINTNKTDCPYFYDCGGCHLRHFNYNETIDLKKKNIINILKKNHIDTENINVYSFPSSCYNYRNKVTFKVVDSIIGFYEEKTNNVIKIDECRIIDENINNLIRDLYKFNIKNGDITLRINNNKEVLLSINTKDKLNEDYKSIIKKNNILGIILNNKLIYGKDTLTMSVDDFIFETSYNSFFQVNIDGCKKIFDLIKENVSDTDKVLDLYSGVGTLSIISASKASKVLGVEVIENAVINAKKNALLNNVSNIEFLCGDVPKIIKNLKNDYNLVIVDPPRAGLDNFTTNYILDNSVEKVIYVSCNPITLSRDLSKLITKYIIKEFNMVDMFPYTYHCETICVLERK